jgi:hypothetical protein
MEEYCPPVFLSRNPSTVVVDNVNFVSKYFKTREIEIAPSEESHYDDFADIWETAIAYGGVADRNKFSSLLGSPNPATAAYCLPPTRRA